MSEVILAGDVGATKTALALYSREQGISAGALHEIRFENGDYASVEDIIVEFLRETGVTPPAASFGVAGPVRHGKAKMTNLPWTVDVDVIRRSFGFDQVFVLNDLEAIATAVPHLRAEQLATLNPGRYSPQGNIAVVAPGTGLGIGFLVPSGDGYRAFASEGGHISFSPQNPQQIELLKFLQQRYDHVSFERICSGSYLPNIYDFLKAQEGYQVPDWLSQALAEAADRTPVIIRAALEQQAEICEASLDIWVQVLGTVIGNIAVILLPYGGIYLGGGIPPRILKRLQLPDFLSAILHKGRYSELCLDMPLHVILDSGAALQGAAWHGLSALQTLQAKR